MWLKLSTLQYGGWSGLSGRPILSTWVLTRRNLLCLWLESDADVSMEEGSGRCTGFEDGEREPKPRETGVSMASGSWKSPVRPVPSFLTIQLWDNGFVLSLSLQFVWQWQKITAGALSFSHSRKGWKMGKVSGPQHLLLQPVSGVNSSHGPALPV